MIGMFDVDWRNSLPLSSVAKLSKVHKPKHDDHTYEVLTQDGQTIGLSDNAYYGLVSAPLQLIPAQPGILALYASFDGDGSYVHKTPVIAWALCFDGSVRVVTPAGVDDGHVWEDGHGYILMPDGTIEGVGAYLDQRSFKTLEDWLAHEQEEGRERLEREAALDRSRITSTSEAPHA
jgi:hypothetical protein